MGDITLGDKTTAQGDGAVAVGGSTHGDIVSGDGAVLGNGNTSADSDALSWHGGTVIQTSGHGTTTVSDGNTSAVDNSSTLTHTSTIDNSQHDASVHSPSIVDSSVHDSSVHDNAIHETTHTDTGLDAHLGF